MTLNFYEQSGCILEAGDGFRLAWDIASFTPIENLAGIAPLDAMLVSHIHSDHFSQEHIELLKPKKLYLNQQCMEAFKPIEGVETQLVTSSCSYDIHPQIEVSYFDADHGPNATQPLRENHGFLIQAEGQKIYFAGDMYNPSGIDVSDLEVEYALLPIGTHYTFGPQEAIDFSKRFEGIQKLVPIHFSIKPQTKTEFDQLISGA